MKISYLIAVAIVGSATALIWWWARLPIAAQPSPQKTDIRTTRSISRPPLESANELPRPVASKESEVRTLTYKQRFEQSRNYWQLGNQLLPAAKAGDADAQLYLWKTLTYCKDANRFYFERRGQRLSLTEGLQWATARNLPLAEPQEAYDRCHDFLDQNDPGLGDPSNWLANATAAGQPIAQAVTASKALMQAYELKLTKAAGVPLPMPEDPTLRGVAPMALLRAAVQSLDPEVLFIIGNSSLLLSPENTDANIEGSAWKLVACERGLDCTASGAWVKAGCAFDPQCAAPVTPTDYIRRLAGDDWVAVQQRAEEINSKLVAGDWDELGLGPSAQSN